MKNSVQPTQLGSYQIDSYAARFSSTSVLPLQKSDSAHAAKYIPQLDKRNCNKIISVIYLTSAGSLRRSPSKTLHPKIWL